MRKYVARRDIASALGIQSATIASWDRRGRGPGKPIYITQRHVVYLETEVQEFFRERGVWEPVWISPQERLAGRGTATRPPQERGVRSQRPAATSDLLKAPSEGENAPNVAPEREGEP
jgi:hypothetical protein